jgi:hypothetical protein
VNCNQCGQPLAADEQTCRNCGTPRPTADNRFSAAEAEYYRLKGLMELGRINREQFDAELKKLMVQDAQGRYWVLGADSGKWYVHDGQSWVESNPPESPVAVSPAPPPSEAGLAGPPVAPPAPAPQKKSRLLPVLLIGCVGFLCILIVVGGSLVALTTGVMNVSLNNLATPTLSFQNTIAPLATLPAVPTPVLPQASTLAPTLAPMPTSSIAVSSTRVLTPPAATGLVATPAVSTVGGVWDSDFGPVTLTMGAAQGNQQIPVTGFWVQPDGKQGTIRSGTFDPTSLVLDLTYFQPWNNAEGTARFTLSADGQTLKGQWVQANAKGDWTMKRPAVAVASTFAPTTASIPLTTPPFTLSGKAVVTPSAADAVEPTATNTRSPSSVAATLAVPIVAPTVAFSPTATRVPPTLTPSVPSGLYVTGLRLEPSPPMRGQEIGFYVTFLNTTGKDQAYRWIIYIYKQPNLRNSFGETTATAPLVPVGTSVQKAVGTWKTGIGPCEDHLARVDWLDESKKPTQFVKPDGTPAEFPFTVCPG